MNDCPSQDSLLGLLDHRLDEAEFDEIVVHVEICIPCQERLEVLTRGDVWKSTLREMPDEPRFDERELNRSIVVGSNSTVDAPGIAQIADAPSLRSGGSTEQATIDHTPAEVDETQCRSDSPDELARPRFSRTLPNCPRIPGYDILQHLGEGGMGIVYKARQVGLNRLVALKMIRGGSQVRPDHRARFSIEAEAVARLRHPNILQIYDIGEVDGMPYVSLELLEGGSLTDRLDGTPQSGRSSADLLRVLSQAIVAAHQAGIIHRDLKPSNVLFTEDGTPKITDFGLAKRLESNDHQTESGQIMGSPSYMAPEQARGHTRDVGPAADVYALGAILYDMLTGRPPFKGESPIETIRQVIDDELVPPSRLVPKVARDLETICLKCLNKESSRRYSSALALVEDLGRYLQGDPILGRRTSPLTRGIKWARRRPLAATLYSLAIAVFLGLTVGGASYERNRRIREGSLSQSALSLIDRAKEANSTVDLSNIHGEETSFLRSLTTEDKRRLKGFVDRVRASIEQVDRRLLDLKEQEENQKIALADRRQFQNFLQLRAQAQLDAAEFELDPANRRARLREATRKALAVYSQGHAAAEEDWVMAKTLPDVLSATERTEVVDGCYDLLLMLSQTTDPASGLKILDRAVDLRPDPTAAYHLRRADCLARAGDIVGQKREVALAGKRPPLTALDHFLIGREHLAKRECSDAITSFEASIRLNPEQIAAQLLLAICEYNTQPKRLREARDNLSACLRRHPDLIELYLLRARVQGEEGNQALSHVESGQRDERAVAAFEAALADYRSALDRRPTDDFRYVLLVNRGGMYLQAGRFAEARADLAAAVRLKPLLYQAHATLGQLYQRERQLDEASLAFGQAIERAVEPAIRAALHRTRALLYANRRDVSPARRSAALHDLQEAIRLEPGHAAQRANDMVERARFFFGGAQFEEALSACRDALDLMPEHPGAHQLRISTLMALKRFDDVLSSCDAYLASEKSNIEILEIRGLARVARQNHSGAVADYTRAFDLTHDLDTGTRSRLLNRRGWAYHFADAPRLALDDFEASLELDPHQSDAHAGRGLARVRLGDSRKAVDDAEAAVRLARRSDARGDGFDDQAQADFNAARIYAQAFEFAAGLVSHEGERAVVRSRAYRSRAVELLEKALRQIPEPARRKEILSDPALQPLRRAPIRSTSARPGSLARLREPRGRTPE